MYEDSLSVEIIINTGNKISLYDENYGMQLFDLQVFNKSVGKSNILLYFSSNIRSINSQFIKGFCSHWIETNDKDWIKDHVHIYPLRLEEQFYAGLV